MSARTKLDTSSHSPLSFWRRRGSDRKTIAVIGTGGSIATTGRSAFDLVDYGEFGRLLPVDALFGRFPELDELADYAFTEFELLHSEAMDVAVWQTLARIVRDLMARGDADGIVIVHGTSTLEEAAWFLDLTVETSIPVVVVGAMRPANGMSSDAAINLAAAVQTASTAIVAECGVVAVLNGEIHAARDVTKVDTYGLGAFSSGALGPLGYVDANGDVVLYRQSRRRHEVFALHVSSHIPRTDIVFAFSGADEVAIDAFVAAGARGLVVASMAPGTCAPLQLAALERAARDGVVVAFSSRAGHGRILPSSFITSRGFIAADNLTPQKARGLLMVALASQCGALELPKLFARI
jgi:L-asparaginase